MKKLKLDLSKQEGIRLTDSETNSITGGGINRSNRRTGNCAYSRKHPRQYPDSTTHEPVTIGCD